MGICWYCYWGWPKPVADIHDRALADLGGDDSPLHYGPAHIVWADENFESAQWCLDHFDEWVADWNGDRYTPAQLAIVRRSLEELRALPENLVLVEPSDYDDESPEDYPPPAGVEMRRPA